MNKEYMVEKCKLNYSEVITFTLIREASSKSLPIINDGEGIEKREPSDPIGNIYWYNHFREYKEVF